MNDFEIVDYDRMFTYLWWEKTNPDEGKFGERWVFAGQDPKVEVWKRIKASLGVRKDLVRDGTVILEAIWDVTDLAKKINRYYKQSRVDDYIRPRIGYRKGSTGEVHELNAPEIKLRVDKYLAQSNQPLPEVGLSAWQARAAEQIIADTGAGFTTIVAELCARFGKTIWSGVLSREINSPLTIVVSYVLTSFASFEKDLSGFDQFKDFVIIDTADPEYQTVIDAAIAQNKQVVAFLSMCVSTKRQQKIDYLFNKSVNRLVIVDEADFGVHKAGQAKPLVQARKPDDVIILMTGTNADKAVGFWPIDKMISTVYPELVMEKRLAQIAYPTTLKHFKIDPTRHKLVVDVEFYQMNLTSVVNSVLADQPELNRDELASWSKFAAYPVKAKGFWTRMLQAVFLGQHGWDDLNADYQFNRSAKEGSRVAMMFLSGSMRNDNLTEAVALAQQALPGYVVIAVYGEEMTNRTAENKVKEAIEKAKKLGQSILLLSAGMAQRSFSVGEITELYLAYDEGDSGATIQKISRALTPDQQGKIGRIVSLSFDPNRDDKFDALLIETAINYKRTHNIKSAKEALRDVLRTVDIFRCTDNGSIKLEADNYLEQAVERKSLNRVAGKTTNIHIMTPDLIRATLQGKADVFRAAMIAAAERGKTRLGQDTGSNAGVPSEEMAGAKLISQLRKVITTIIENMDIVLKGTGTRYLSDAFDIIEKDPLRQKAIKEEFNLDFAIIQALFTMGVINTDLIELQVDH